VGAPGDLLQAAEKQNLDADRLGNGRHETIVTCDEDVGLVGQTFRCRFANSLRYSVG
jgi:hypothetical protein